MQIIVSQNQIFDFEVDDTVGDGGNVVQAIVTQIQMWHFWEMLQESRSQLAHSRWTDGHNHM